MGDAMADGLTPEMRYSKQVGLSAVAGDAAHIIPSIHVSECVLPCYGSRVQAGFPSPADDHMDGSLDLTQHLVPNPTATFFVRATGSSMLGAGIHDGDLLIVDRSLTPRSGRIVIAAVDGELTVKRLRITSAGRWLEPENDAYQQIPLTDSCEITIWGVVTNVIHPL